MGCNKPRSTLKHTVLSQARHFLLGQFAFRPAAEPPGSDEGILTGTYVREGQTNIHGETKAELK